MDTIDPDHDKKLSRRTVLKGGLIAGGRSAAPAPRSSRAVVVSGDRRLRGEPPPPAAAHSPTPVRRVLQAPSEHPRDPRRPAALPAVVLAGRDAASALPPNLAAPARAARVASPATTPPPTTARPSRATLLTGLYTHQTGCMITGGSTLDPGLPDVGLDAARTRLPDPLVRQVAPDPPRQPLDAPRSARAALESYGFAGGIFPSPDGAPGQGWRVDPHIADAVRGLVRARGRRASPGARPSRSSTPTTSRGGTRGATASRTRRGAARASAGCHPTTRRPSSSIARRKPRLQRSLQETAARVVRGGPVHRARIAERWLAVPRPLREAPARGRPADRRGPARRSRASPRSPPTRSSCSPPTTASTAPRTACAARARAPTRRRIRVPLLVKDPRGVLTSAPAASAHAADLERRRRAAAADDRDRLRRAWRREPHYSHLADRLDLAAVARRPGRARARRTSCTPPTRS